MPGSQHQGVFGIPRSNLAGYERSPGPITAVRLSDVLFRTVLGRPVAVPPDPRCEFVTVSPVSVSLGPGVTGLG